MRSKLLLTFSLTAWLLGCSGGADPKASKANFDAAAYDSALDAVTQVRDKARQNGNEWSGTQALTESAAELAANGQWEGAVALLNDARHQYELALAQSTREAHDWQGRVVR